MIDASRSRPTHDDSECFRAALGVAAATTVFSVRLIHRVEDAARGTSPPSITERLARSQVISSPSMRLRTMAILQYGDANHAPPG
jgi:hypothetical protein